MYKKYIYKNGKKLGPYYYESKRIGSTIKTVYLGTNPKKKVALPSSKHIIHLTTSFLILLSILGFFFIKNYTGFTVIQPYIDHLNLNINQSQSYTWQLQNPGNLNSLKISGLILGTGKVKISIKNNNLTYVIFDNSKSNLLTGSVIEPDLYSIIDTSKKNKTKEKQPENITENITQPIQNLSENIPVENTSISEVYKVVDTPKQENLTNQTTINQSEISQTNLNLTEKAFRFDNICIETCSLIGFNSDPYDILFELENTTLILNSIEYSINIPEPNLNAENLTITAEFPENLTLSDVSLQNITNLSITQNLTNLQNLSKLEIKDSKKQKINYSIIKQDKDELDIELSNRHIKTINFKGIRNLTELYIDDIPVEKIKEIKFKEIYSIDPTSLDFDNATITAVATGNSLYKCKEWNSTEQKCYGSWIKLFDLTPGQTYSLTLTKEDPAFGEIEITKALHLDQNYILISDIYEQVKEKDNIWSEPIYNKEYVRVTFYQNLTNKNDITVYVRNLQGFETTIEVYGENSNEKIVEFPMINNEGYYQVLLTNMTGEYQTFDLKIKSSDSNAYLEFDHIIDPINSVTLNDPTTNLAEWSGSWFWMNCTVAKQGQPDTPASLQFHHNNSDPAMRRIPVNTSSTTLNTSSTNPINPFVYDTMYKINVSTPNAENYQIQCVANNSAGTTVYSAIRKITVLQTNVTFNQSTLSLSVNQGATQSFLQTANITSYGTNNDVNVSCLTGSCSTITTNFTAVDLLDNQTKTAFFNCSTGTTGFFSANFTVNSTEYQNSTLTDTQQVNVSCTIIADTTPPNIFIINPSNNSVLASGSKVYANYTYGTDSNTIWYELDSNNTNITITTGSNITFTNLQEIMHNISVYANDSNNNINASFINFSINLVIPTAFNIAKNTTTIYTGTQVNFSANWTDNTGLSGYIFTWNNSGTWINSSFALFNGAYVSQNISNVTASTGTYICWKFFANDTSDNWNMTMANQCFTVSTLLSYCSGNFNNSQTAFNITTNVVCANETMDINGNITIASGGNLTLKNATIRFTGAGADGYNYINKTENGGLWIYDNDNNASTSNDASNISSSTISYYDFWAFGNGLRDNFTLRNSIITEVGYLTNSQGIQIYNVSNIIVSGNNVSGGVRYGLYLFTSTSNNITSNTITTNGTSGVGIFLSTSSNSNTLQSNTITTNDTLSYGAYLLTSDFNNFSFNTINSSNSDSILIDQDSDNNTISSNTIKFSKYSGIRIQNSSSGIMPSNNTITNNNITNATNGISILMNTTRPFNVNHTIENNNITFTTNAIYVSNSSNINISLGIIRNSTNGIVLYNSKQVNSTNITFTNNLYDFNITNGSSLTSINNSFNKTVKVMDNSNFTIMWFLDINATDDSNNLLSSANITVYDNSTGALNSKLTYTKQTGTNGLTGNTIVIEYIQNSTGNQTIYIPYNITGSKIDYNFNSTLDYTDKSKLFKFTIPVIPPITYCSGNFNNSNVNFDVSTNVVCANESMNINGNITILSGGNLTLKNITIIFQSTADGSRFINKTENGGLWIYDNDNNQSTSNDASNITSNNTNFEYDFWAYGKGLRDNFTLQNSIITEVGYSTNSRGIQFYNISNITIIGNNVSGGSGFGLYMQYSTDNNLTNNNLITTANLGFGFYLISSSNSNTVINNSITTTGSTGFGIYLISSSNSNISRNTITTTQDSGYGIFLNSSSNSNIVSNNSITTSGSSAGYGFRLANSNFNNITNNSITTSGNDSDGFFIVSSNSTLIENNLITMSGLCVLGSAGCPDGIIIRVGDDVNITGTVIDNTNPNIVSGYGISIADASNTSIKNNNITTRATNGYGIYLNGSISNNVINNNATTTGNSGYGIYLISSSNSNTLQSNDITTSNRSSYGIYLFLSSNSNVSSNTISTNETLSYGIYLAASDSNNISLNTINSSNSDSIFLDRNSNNNTISYNTLKFSKNSAIRIQNTTSGIMSQNNTIKNNNITNATNGISIFMNSTRPFSVNNTIENNNITFTTNAIYISNSSNINISLGIIRNSTNGIVLYNSKQVNATNITFTANIYDFNITNSSSLTSINNTFNKTVKVLDNSNFTIMWFAEVYVNDNQANTNVSVWNATGVRHRNSTTNSQGLTPLFLLTEYIRNNTDNLTSNNPFNFTASNTTFFNSTSKNITQSQRITLSFLGGANIAPNVTSISLTPSFPNTTINLNCSFVITDPDAGNNLTVNLTWYKNNTINKTYTSISVTNGTLNMHYLNNANTTKNDNWSCGIRPYDQTDWGNELNSSIVTIQNSQPSTPSLTSPADGNKTTNRSETFIWAASTDPDNDPITYTINISCWGGCSADNRLVNITAINYTPAELKYFIDDNYYYNWTVKAIDSDANSSSYAAERNLSLQVLVSLTLPNSTVLFGTKNIGDSVNTSNNTPSPIVMQNDGNSYININLSSQSTLFTTQPNPSTNYQYKIDNTSLEAGSFNWTGSVTTWTNIPLQNNTAVNLLNYSNLNDTAEMDILITVPSNEPPGNLTSNLILTGYYIANYP